jgi:hypothetical protein
MNNEDEAYSAGQLGHMFTGGGIREYFAYQRGKQNKDGGSGATLLLMAPVVITLLACFWPLVGASTLASVMTSEWFLDRAFPGHSGIVTLITVFAVGAAALYLSIRLERVLQRSAIYRFLRHAARLILLAAFLVSYYFTLDGPLAPRYIPDHITLRWLDSQLSPTAYVVIFALLVVAHIVSRRLDERIEIWIGARQIAGVAPDVSNDAVEAIAEEMAAERSAKRAERRSQRLKAGGVLGTIGAIFLVAIGEPAGSVLFGFFFFGLIGALLSRFVPWNSFRRPSRGKSKASV